MPDCGQETSSRLPAVKSALSGWRPTSLPRGSGYPSAGRTSSRTLPDLAMSIPRTPTGVTVYVNTPEARVTAARFRWSPAEGVTVEVPNQEWGEIAQRWYDDGIPFDQQRRKVTRDEPEAFMRA